MRVQVEIKNILSRQISWMMVGWMIAGACLFGTTAEAAKGKSRVRSGDEVWFLSSRRLGFPRDITNCDVPLEVKRYDDGWQNAKMSDFLDNSSSGDDQVTLFYLHGNRKDRSTSFSDGWQAYRKLVKQTNPKLRVKFVIYSWPSSKQHGQYRDVLSKASRLRIDSFYLGWLLTCMKGDQKISLVGHSYGGSIILGALHVSNGGKLCGKQIDVSAKNSKPPVRVILLAAAEHNYRLKPGSKHDHAYARIDEMLNFYNPCDPILKWYRFIDRCNKPEAMGRTGVAGRKSLEDGGERITQVNASCYIGCTHYICDYLSSRTIVKKITKFAFWKPIGDDKS